MQLSVGSQRGTSTLEVIAALILFSFAAAGLAVVLPLAYGRADRWSDWQSLAWFLERNLEEWRSIPYEDLPVGSGTLTAELINGRQFNGSFATTMASEAQLEHDATWNELAALPDAPEHGLSAEYYRTSDFSGVPLTRIDAQIAFNWGSHSPDSGIAADGFTVRWRGLVEAQYSETYTFFTTTAVGVRLWINDTQLINNWDDHETVENQASVDLKAGKKYQIRLEVLESYGTAAVTLSWQSPSTAKQVIPSGQLYHNLPKKTNLTVRSAASNLTLSGHLLVFPTYFPEPLTGVASDRLQGLAGLYFASLGNRTPGLYASVLNLRFTGHTYARLDPTIDFRWGNGAPAPELPSDYFGVRWTGFVIPPTTGNYYFSTNTDDGVRLWVNHQLLINQWNRHSTATEHTANALTLQAGVRYPVTMDLFEWTGDATAQLSWSGPAIAKQIIPQSQLYPAYSPAEDTYIDQKNTTTNYGGNVTLDIRDHNTHSRYSYLKFAISGITGKTIKSATLRLYAVHGGDTGFEIRQAAPTWNEAEVDWTTKPSLTPDPVLGSYRQEIADATFIEVKIDPAFLAKGDGRYSLALIPTGGNHQVSFSSRESYPHTGNGEEYRPDRGPRLILEVGTAHQPSGLELLYQCRNSKTTSNTLAPWFQVLNNGTNPIALSRITLRYWLTDEHWWLQPLTPPFLECDWARVGAANVTAKFVAGPQETGYIELGFSDAAGVLAPGQSSGEIQTRIHNSLWLSYNQSNDYSFAPGMTAYGSNSKITAYLDGELVFGTEP